jgi:hypothetical protein
MAARGLRARTRVKHRTRSATARSLREQRLGWLLAALVLLVWPAASWHESTTVHAICPEHGERLDVASTDAPSGAAPTDEHDAEGAGNGAEGAHEECPFVLLAQPTSSDCGAPQWRIEALEPRAHVASVAHEAHRSTPLLLLAPKQSPPG